jgi:hypothetical protein
MSLETSQTKERRSTHPRMSCALLLLRAGSARLKPEIPATRTDVSTTPRELRRRSAFRRNRDLRPAPGSAVVLDDVQDFLVR